MSANLMIYSEETWRLLNPTCHISPVIRVPLWHSYDTIITTLALKWRIYNRYILFFCCHDPSCFYFGNPGLDPYIKLPVGKEIPARCIYFICISIIFISHLIQEGICPLQSTRSHNSDKKYWHAQVIKACKSI